MAIVPSKPQFSLFVSVALIKNNKRIIDSKYLKYTLYRYLKTINVDHVIKGGLLKNFHLEDIRKTRISLPPLPEQRAIVSKIEQLFSELDNGIANLKSAKEKLEIYRQAVLKKAFEGKLSKTMIEDDENDMHDLSIAAEPQEPYNHSSGNLPKGWKWVKLKGVSSKIGSGATPKGGKENYKTEGIPLVRSLNIHFNYIKHDDLAFIDEQQAKKLDNVIVHESDILLNITGASIGRVNIAPKEFDGGRVNQHVSIIRLNEFYLPKFVKYFIQSPKIQTWINNTNYGVTRQALTKSMIENLEIPNLDLKQQHQIVKAIETRLSVCDKLAASIDESLEKAEALRQSILKKAFEGKLLTEAELEACRNELDWEPAEKLLERIKENQQ